MPNDNTNNANITPQNLTSSGLTPNIGNKDDSLPISTMPSTPLNQDPLISTVIQNPPQDQNQVASGQMDTTSSINNFSQSPNDSLSSFSQSFDSSLEDTSILSTSPTPIVGDRGIKPSISSGNSNDSFGSVTTTSPHVPQKYGGKKIIATIFGLLLLVGAVAAGVTLVRRTQLFRQEASEAEGKIAIFKFICDSTGQQDVCNGRDTSLGDYKVDYKVHSGENDQGPVVQTITVTISDNNNGQGNTGNSSQGRKEGEGLNSGTYTVCEIPIAYNSTGDRIPLDVEPRPNAGGGGSSGGTNQRQYGTNCITVDLNTGEAELKFLDKRQTPAASPTPTPIKSPTPTPKNGASATPSTTMTPSPIPTLPPDIVAKCLEVKTYDENGDPLSSIDLPKLKVGDEVTFAVAGQTSSGTFTKARFSINGTSVGESTNKNSNGEYYLEYTIPTGVTTFTVKGEVYHSTLGWI